MPAYDCLMVEVIVHVIVCVKCWFVLYIEDILLLKMALVVQKNWFVTKTPKKLGCLSAA